MKTRAIPKEFATVNDLKYKNLLVSGCSFTYNNSDTNSLSWPYYLRDKGGFTEVYDCSGGGAGNYQIYSSVIYALETLELDPADTFVAVMWSGYNRDDIILPTSASTLDGAGYRYNNNVVATRIPYQESRKNMYSSALENYVRVVSLWNYLKQHNYQFIFLEYVDSTLPHRGDTFNISRFLDKNLKTKFLSMFADAECIYNYCVKYDLLDADEFHPSPQGHLEWTHKVLLPMLSPNPKY